MTCGAVSFFDASALFIFDALGRMFMSGCMFHPVSAVVDWKDKTSNLIRTREFSYVLDEPKSDKGNDLGPTPAEVLLWSAAGCVAISIEQIAIHRGISFNALRTEASAVFRNREEGMQNLRFKVYVTSDSPQEVFEAIAEKVLRVSPILNSLKTKSTIEIIMK